VSARWRGGPHQGPAPPLLQPSGRKDHGSDTPSRCGSCARLDQGASLRDKELFARHPLHSGPSTDTHFQKIQPIQIRRWETSQSPHAPPSPRPLAPLAPGPHLAGTRCLVKKLRGEMKSLSVLPPVKRRSPFRCETAQPPHPRLPAPQPRSLRRLTWCAMCRGECRGEVKSLSASLSCEPFLSGPTSTNRRDGRYPFFLNPDTSGG